MSEFRDAQLAYDRAARERDSLACVIAQGMVRGMQPSAGLVQDFKAADLAALDALRVWQAVMDEDSSGL